MCVFEVKTGGQRSSFLLLTTDRAQHAIRLLADAQKRTNEKMLE